MPASRRSGSRLGAALSLALAAAACSGQPPAEVPAGDAAPPHIVWIVADKVDPAAGPRIAALAARATTLPVATGGAAHPAALRAALLTGQPPRALGVDTRTGRLLAPPPPGVRLVPERLRRAGYYTSRAGPVRHALGVDDPPPPAGVRLAQAGLLGAWDAAGPDADWRDKDKDWDLPCTVSFGCGGPGGGPRPFFALFDHAADEPATGVDRAVGRLLDRLEADGHAARTAVFLIGVGETPTVVVRWPAQGGPGATRDAPVGMVDVAAMTLALAEVPHTGAPGRVAVGRAADGGRIVAASPHDAVVAPVPVDAGGSPPVAATPAGYPTGGLFHVAPRVELWCDTEGSTIVYTTEREPPYYWRLYDGPFRMRFWTLRAQCGRLGYRDSPIMTYEFDIE